MKTPKFLLSLKPKYVQAPVGWWQDDKRREQPPGSYPPRPVVASLRGRYPNEYACAEPATRQSSERS